MNDARPNIDDAKDPDELARQTDEVNALADAVLKSPTVANGFENIGRPPQIAFTNAATMAMKRLKGLFPTADRRDPLFARIYAEFRLICAECIRLLYECRERRTPYNHILDANVRCRKFARDNFNRYREAVERLSESSPI